MKTLISIQNLIWEVNNKTVLHSIHWNILKNEHWVLLGRNGSGKTSLINFLYGYKHPTLGEIEVFGKRYGEYSLREIQKRIGILEASHQESRLQRNLTVKEILMTGFLSTIGLYSDINDAQRKKLEILLQENPWINPEQNFDTLSAGEKKKVLLLRALANEPEILILDEPCSSLDVHAREDFYSLLYSYYKKKEFTSILITHRVDEVPKFYTHAFLMKNGKCVAQGKINEVFTKENLSRTFDLQLDIEKRNGRYFFIVE
ncbi:MAG: ATP-binding cassette domain-containing protein [Leptospiraceae bacterium]|nr:ATP-binding cassette domain-containing protein [Leptospiraceae bacterium]